MNKDHIDNVKYLGFLTQKLEDANIKSVAHLSRLIYSEDEKGKGKTQYLRNVLNGTNPSADLIERTCTAFNLPTDFFKLDTAKEAAPSEFEELKARVAALEQKTDKNTEDIEGISQSLAQISIKTLKEFIETVKAALLRK